ncbi:MAG: indolepyruvate oxidoreductase subunit beta [Candidatus Methanomethylophilaceae archaeon]|nr:indolepyruvate oxidoreductase subunit beta [Candidatus Methanomethylophilaceae archaeon]
MTDIVLCGVGGQGTVLASKLIAAAAMDKGLDVMSAETIGMAQKGGSVFSHLRVGRKVHTPMIAKDTADIIIAFEPAEAVRMLPYLKKGGSVIVNSHAVKPVTSVLKDSGYDGSEMVGYLKENVENLTVIDCEKACREIGSPKVTNMVLLGAAVRSGVLDFTMEEITETMKRMVKPQFQEANVAALNYRG